MRKLLIGILTVVSLFLASCDQKFRGCGIVVEKYISNSYFYIVLELANGRRTVIGDPDPIEGLSSDTWANAKIGEKYCQ